MHSPDEQFRQVQHVVVPEPNAGQRIDNFLMSLLKTVPRSLVYRLLRTGQVRVNKGRVKPGFKLTAGDSVRVPPVTVASESEVHLPSGLIKQVERAVIAETEHWIVINKPSGLAVHGGTGVKFGVIDLIHRIYDDNSISLVHRLDRGTSGCLVLAKNRPASIHFQNALLAGVVDKKYLAVLNGRMKDAVTVDVPLLKNQPEDGERLVVVNHNSGKSALTRFFPRQPGKLCSLVDIEIETGRTHQIRVHAAHLGHPVLGDTRYGDRQVNRAALKSGANRMYLHAAKIGFPALPSSTDSGKFSRFESLPESDWSKLASQLSGI